VLAIGSLLQSTARICRIAFSAEPGHPGCFRYFCPTSGLLSVATVKAKGSSVSWAELYVCYRRWCADKGREAIKVGKQERRVLRRK
jgi:hypothetical protein